MNTGWCGGSIILSPLRVTFHLDQVKMLEILVLLLLAAGGWLFWDSLKAREIANTAMRAACRAHGLLFLDDTVALESLWPARDDDGRMQLRRIFGFEYSDTGHNRRKGSLTLLGTVVADVDVGPLPEAEAPPG